MARRHATSERDRAMNVLGAIWAAGNLLVLGILGLMVQQHQGPMQPSASPAASGLDVQPVA
jgi:hypothetical protein